MHNAPSVTYPVGRSFFQVALSMGLALLSAGLGLGWTLSRGHFGAAQGVLLLLLLWLLAAVAAVRSWLRPARGELQWDGQDWVWRSGVVPEIGRVAVRLDWQNGLLLAFYGASGRMQWFWLARSADALRWAVLRRALYAAPSQGAVPPDAGSLAP